MWDSDNQRGLLVDFDLSSPLDSEYQVMGEDSSGPGSRKAFSEKIGATLFMAIDLLDKDWCGTHTFLHELESYLYVTMWITAKHPKGIFKEFSFPFGWRVSDQNYVQKQKRKLFMNLDLLEPDSLDLDSLDSLEDDSESEDESFIESNPWRTGFKRGYSTFFRCFIWPVYKEFAALSLKKVVRGLGQPCEVPEAPSVKEGSIANDTFKCERIMKVVNDRQHDTSVYYDPWQIDKR